MIDGNSKNNKLSWSKSLVRRWFSIKGKAQDLHAYYVAGRESTDEADAERLVLDAPKVTKTLEYRIFVSTWNVGGKSPPSNLNLEDWLHTSPLSDIYVLGFQEIVPLSAGNILVTEDHTPAEKWVSIIRKTLNSSTLLNEGNPGVKKSSEDLECSPPRQWSSSFFHRHSFQSLNLSTRMNGYLMVPQTMLDHRQRHSVYGQGIYRGMPSGYCPGYKSDEFSDDENNINGDSLGESSLRKKDGSAGCSRYCLLASKQMVGIFLSIWVKGEIRDDIRKVKVSCVGRGLMGYLGNKGSIAISMLFHQTSFCFICSHLTSGQKEGDGLRRNSDAMGTLRKTRFPPVHRYEKSPETILEHDRIVWLGDLNYRISLSHRSAKALVEMRNWDALLEKDQLRMEQRDGHIFEGWNEGRIYFPPTYKYSNNSDRYAGEDEIQQTEKCRTPAWCDRILWYGEGLDQQSYFRGESRFSDHRPVSSIFTAEVGSSDHQNQRKPRTFSSSRSGSEELFRPFSHGYSVAGKN